MNARGEFFLSFRARTTQKIDDAYPRAVVRAAPYSYVYYTYLHTRESGKNSKITKFNRECIAPIIEVSYTELERCTPYIYIYIYDRRPFQKNSNSST